MECAASDCNTPVHFYKIQDVRKHNLEILHLVQIYLVRSQYMVMKLAEKYALLCLIYPTQLMIVNYQNFFLN